NPSCKRLRLQARSVEQPSSRSAEGDGEIRAPVVAEVQICPTAHNVHLPDAPLHQPKATDPARSFAWRERSMIIQRPDAAAVGSRFRLDREHFRSEASSVQGRRDPRRSLPQQLPLHPCSTATGCVECNDVNMGEQPSVAVDAARNELQLYLSA